MYALISCTKVKQDYTCPAKEMYMKSSLFSKAVGYIEEQEYEDWFILSAKHGLLRKDDVIEPYNVTLNKMKITERISWSEKVLEQLIQLNIKSVDFYAGLKYREFLIPLLIAEAVSCRVPLRGKGIGEQLQFYTQMTKTY